MKSYWQSEQDTGRQEKAQLLWQQLIFSERIFSDIASHKSRYIMQFGSQPRDGV